MRFPAVNKEFELYFGAITDPTSSVLRLLFSRDRLRDCKTFDYVFLPTTDKLFRVELCLDWTRVCLYTGGIYGCDRVSLDELLLVII